MISEALWFIQACWIAGMFAAHLLPKQMIMLRLWSCRIFCEWIPPWSPFTSHLLGSEALQLSASAKYLDEAVSYLQLRKTALSVGDITPSSSIFIKMKLEPLRILQPEPADFKPLVFCQLLFSFPLPFTERLHKDHPVDFWPHSCFSAPV